MLERRRHQYLSIIGIDSYVPRKILPAAPAPVLLSAEQIGAEVNFLSIQSTKANVPHYSEDLAHTGANDPGLNEVGSNDTGAKVDSALMSNITALVASAELTTALSSQSIDDSLVESAAAKKLDNALTDIKETSTQETELDPNETKQALITAQVGLKFVLTVWRIKDHVLVIDSRQSGSAYPTDRLLQNILRAVGLPLAQLPESEMLRWPLFINKQNLSKTIAKQNQDAAQARAMVQAYISSQLAKQTVKALWLMGDNSANFALDRLLDKENSENSEKINQAVVSQSVVSQAVESDNAINPWNIPIAVMPSLFSMLQEPTLKAKAWSVLKKMSSF